MRKGWGVRAVVVALMLLATLSGPDRVSLASDSVEHRIADFWKRIDAMQPGDYLSSGDLGQWALNVIERDARARLTVADFRASTAGMQAALERAGPAPIAPPRTSPAGGVEQRIADFWKRIDAMQPGDYLSSADLGQWALNVIERDASARLTVADFRASTAGMQAALERAGPAPIALPRFELLRFQFTASIPEADRVDLDRGTRIGLERLRTTLGEEIGEVFTIYAIASAAGERHRVTFDRPSCCVAGSKALFGEYAAYYDVSNPNWNNPRITGASRTTQHRKVAVHELIHIWQDWSGCLITRELRRPVPVWFFEGMAEYLAHRFMAEAGDESASEVDQHEAWARSEAKRLLSTLPLSSVEAQHPAQGSDLNGPSVTAVKMLADSHGRPALRDFCKRSAREDWRTVFTEIFGRPVERFYEEYAADLSRP